jgi:hypothetical protein
MGGDKKLETMSEEIKLLKGELKQSLASVRDYLLNMELPSSEFSNILDALDNGEGQKVTMTGTLAAPEETKKTAETSEEVEEVAPEIPPEDNLIDVEGTPVEEAEVPAASSITTEEESFEPEEPPDAGEEPEEESLAETTEEPEEVLAPEAALNPEESVPVDLEKVPTEPGFTTPKVNMLANLIAWVAKAKKEIGEDRLPTLLEVYGISGHLSSELKEVIIQLAEIAAARPDTTSEAGVWSEAMLSLHGILTGGDAPVHPVLPSLASAVEEMAGIEGEAIEEETPKEPPFKLKLVLPNGDGEAKEFCINLTPEVEESNGAKKKRKK